MSSEDYSVRTGAYGLTPDLPTGLGEWLNPAPPDWTPWKLYWRPLEKDLSSPEHIGPDTAEVRILPAGRARISRRTQTTDLHLEKPPSDHGMIHPHLGSTAILNAYWQGWQSFHSGVFAMDGKAWALLGDRRQGKTSALAWLVTHGVGVLSDDLLILREGTALAGPRSLDLRSEASAHFGIGTDIGVVGTRRRWRARLADTPAELPFGGFIVLGWSDSISTHPVPASQRFTHIASNAGLQVPPKNPQSWLELASLPMVAFNRPMDWGQMDTAMDQLLEHLSGHPR